MKKRNRPLKREIGTDRICAIWTTIPEYMNFYKQWVGVCAALDRRSCNPNVELARRCDWDDTKKKNESGVGTDDADQEG